MKITMKTENGEYSVEEQHISTIDDVLHLYLQLLKAAGFYPQGNLELVES